MNQFAVDRRHGVLLVKFAGPMTLAALDAMHEELKAFIGREGTMSTVIDFTGASSIDVAASTLVSRGRSRSLMNGKPRVFVSPDALLFGLLRMYGSYQDAGGEKPPLIVHSLSEAFEALGLIDAEFEPVAIDADTTEAAILST
jgi:hypothetical protein